jgi:hypothetical protein
VTHCLKAAVKAAAAAAAAADSANLLSMLLQVQEAACFCLTNLTYRHPANRNRVMVAGGATALVAVLNMRYHATNLGPTTTSSTTSTTANSTTTSASPTAATTTVLFRACMALDNLASSASCQEEMIQADALEAVCAVMLAPSPCTRDYKELQLYGCQMLGRLAENTGNLSQVQRRVVQANGVVAVSQAFQRFHPTDPGLARTASAALQCLTAYNME